MFTAASVRPQRGPPSHPSQGRCYIVSGDQTEVDALAITEAVWTTGGSPEDFDALFIAHWAEVYRLLYRMLGDDAEDAAQEVFLKLHTRPPRSSSNYRAWLYTVATREGLNRLRSRGRQDGMIGRVKALLGTQAELSPESATELHDEQRQVRALLGRMRPLYAQLLLLRHEGLEYTELAETLSVSKGSVGTLLARAEQQFAKLYEEAGGTA